MISVLGDCLNHYKEINKLFSTIYYKGNSNLLLQKKIAIVGTRRPNNYTKSITHTLASGLSQRDIIIVSGAAMGVDAIAHNACQNYQTIAVVANGLDIRYPSVNKKLIEQIEQHGLMLSPFEENVRARSYHFVQRNELVIALSDAVIITQADLNSGSLTSAKFALKHNKPIYVLPHRITESLGTQKLLEEGKATAIYDIEKFLNGFAPLLKKEDVILEYFQSNPSYEEAFLQYEEALLEYELEGKITINNGFVTVV